MDFFTPDFFSALLAIIVIDLVLAGDNAIVIAMAARNLPAHLQKKAIIWVLPNNLLEKAYIERIFVSPNNTIKFFGTSIDKR